MRTIEATTLAYLAGMIDADGFISITRSSRKGHLYFGAQIGIAGTRREPHDLAASLWGGKVSRYEPKNPKHRAQYQWSRVGQSAVQAIQDVFPYLLIKQDHALLALELADHVMFSKSDDPFPWFGPDFNAIAVMHDMRERMIGMNQSRNRVGKGKAGRVLDGRTWDEVPVLE
jgi:hypothetical protein